MLLAEADRPRWRDDSKGPRGQAPKDIEVPLQERAEAANFGVGRELEKYRSTVQIDPNRELLERRATHARRRLANAGGRQPIGFDPRQRREVNGLLVVSCEPDELRVREHGVEQHQTVDDAGR